MKKVFRLLMVLLFFISVSQAQVKMGFSMNGSVKRLKGGSKLLLIIKKGNKIDTVSRSTAKNEMFVFKDVKLPYFPDFYLLCIQTEFVENLKLFLDQAGDVKINGDLKKWPDVMVSGSTSHDDFNAARKIRDKVWDDGFVKKYPDGMADPDSAMIYSKQGVSSVFEQMPESKYLPAMIATWVHPGSVSGYIVSADVKEPFYNQLTESVKNTYYGRILGAQIASYANNKLWMEKLEKSIVDLKSITRTEVLGQLSEVANKLIEVNLLPVSGKQLNVAELESKSKAATVIVSMGFRSPRDSVTRPNPTSAYVIDESGICVTNYHVGEEYSSKEPYKSLSIMTAEGKTYPVTKILSCSESDDLMVFQVDTKGDKLSALPLSNKAAEEAKIHVMGHPLGKFYQFTSGVVSGYSTATLAGKPCNIMSITADFNVGSSGGPIVDDYGNVVGTVSRIDG